MPPSALGGEARDDEADDADGFGGHEEELFNADFPLVEVVVSRVRPEEISMNLRAQAAGTAMNETERHA